MTQSAILVLAIGLLLLLTPVASRPTDIHLKGERPVTLNELNGEEEYPTQGSIQEVGEQMEGTEEYHEGEVSITGEVNGERPSEFFLQEVREQLEKMNTSTEEIHVREDREIHDHRILYHGNTIALKYRTDQWLGCSAEYTHCKNQPCPRLFMEGSDWQNCWGEVFRIYRMSPGAIHAGDIVGIYYPQESSWLGCAGTNCGRETCPGYPSFAYGFSQSERWLICYGEVYKIYARGKNLGEFITEYDYISLFYLQQQNWVSFYNSPTVPFTHHHPCPGTTRPPDSDTYETCFGEVAQIFKL